MRLLFALVVIFSWVLSCSAYSFPLYKQCDPRWGSTEMGVKGPGERATICQQGCAMSSTAMALAGLGVTIDNQPVNPGNFNKWLEANSGYLCLSGDCCNLNLYSPEKLSSKMNLIGETEKPSFEEIAKDIKNERIIHIAHVRNKTHFVLLTDAILKTKSFFVNDPGFNVTMYPYANISDIIRFKIDVYPVYKQCDPKWGANTMGKNGQTVCAVGCLMSSISSGLAGTDIQINNQIVATPGTLNEYMKAHHGYWENTSDLMESVVPSIAPNRISWNATTGMHLKNDIPFDTIKALIDAKVPKICIANVMDGHHFVLVVGYRSDGDTLVVNDSGFNRNTYSYSKDVVGWRLFDMRSA